MFTTPTLTVDGLAIYAPVSDVQKEILSPEALTFAATLMREFGDLS